MKKKSQPIRVRLPKGMPRTVAEMKKSANNDEHFRIALAMGLHGDPMQKKYARAWMAHAWKRIKTPKG